MALTFSARERRRLTQARETGFLDATCRDNDAIVKAYGLWCWRLKIPMVWFERHSPHSRFGRLRLDLLTTPHRLTGTGEATMQGLGAAQVSPHDAVFERVPLAHLEKLAHGVFRAAIDERHYLPNRSQVMKMDVQSAKSLHLVPPKIASA